MSPFWQLYCSNFIHIYLHATIIDDHALKLNLGVQLGHLTTCVQEETVS